MKTFEFNPHYSGAQSRKFWAAINAHKRWKVLYSLGVKLQNIEEEILWILNKKDKYDKR